MSKNDLVLFLKTNLNLEDEIFINDLEKFPDKENNENLLLEINETIENIKTNKILENIAQILGQDNYNWEPDDFLNLNND
ncbi:22203_t:CDS:1, partial [Cetraspora pellucida]